MEEQIEYMILDKKKVDAEFSDIDARLFRAKQARAFEYVHQMECVRTELRLFLSACMVDGAALPVK